ILEVEECAWTGRAGFNAILGFLARFDADYGEIKLLLPKGIDLLRIIRSPRAYDINKRTRQDFMVRAVNAKKVLELIRKPADCEFTVKVTDKIIEENNRTFRVRGNDVEAIDAEVNNAEVDDVKINDVESTENSSSEAGNGQTGKADIELSVQAFSQMAVGAVSFDEALLRGDVTVNANEETLRRVFVEKNIFVGEHF
ncbi:MAG: sterol carrier protein domain-containing protein, partial [Lachnospiraceae bacterium]|nr:sterol carrier protein domain-containing protein [Lachnospiraceae bacterium]MBP5330858.1 sterol carrier protein domain-containing protein [Lachnospiraceae bacterium]